VFTHVCSLLLHFVFPIRHHSDTPLHLKLVCISVKICADLCPIKDSQIIDVPLFFGNEVVVHRNAKTQARPPFL
jgi:translation initiation factor RLI1